MPIATAAEQTIGNKSRRPKFNPDQDHVILRELEASKAYIAVYDNKKLLYRKSEDGCNRNLRLSAEQVDYKAVQDRYTFLQKDYDKKNRRESHMSSIGGEVGEAYELLGIIKDARDTKEAEENLDKAEREEREERKLRSGAALVCMATTRGSSA